MRGAKLLGIGAALALVALAAGTAKTSQVTITVCASGCQFSSIQMAILSAPEGSTIQVRAGYTKKFSSYQSLSASPAREPTRPSWRAALLSLA
jgi:pectin methylesterase-like acyl-CoA thioesterase